MRKFLEGLPYFIFFLLFLETFGSGNSNFFIMLATYGTLLISSTVSALLNYKEGKTDKVFFLVILLSFSLGLLYIYNTPYNVRNMILLGLLFGVVKGIWSILHGC